MSYSIDRHNIHEYLGIEGVGGPGDDFMSSGPHGETSMQAQQKAAQPATPSDDSGDGTFFDSIFEDGGDGEPMPTAEPIGPEFEDTANNILNDPSIFEPDPVTNPVVFGGGTPIATPSGGSSADAGVEPASSEPSSPSGGMSSTSTLLLVAAVIGVGYAILGK